MTDERAIRYRRLAMQESNPDNAKLLRLLADQAESGLLHTPSSKPIAPHTPSAVPVIRGD